MSKIKEKLHDVIEKGMKQTAVELLGHYGDDTVHASSAWTSTSRDLSEEKAKRPLEVYDRYRRTSNDGLVEYRKVIKT
jgi:cytolysin (calcineurin-like family phosphatase)